MSTVDGIMLPFEVLKKSHKTLTLGLQWTKGIQATGSSAELDLLSLLRHISVYQLLKERDQAQVFSCVFQFINFTYDQYVH
jgi:hypothetical protein